MPETNKELTVELDTVTYLNWLKRLSAAPTSLARLLPNILYLEILNLIFIATPLQGDTN